MVTADELRCIALSFPGATTQDGSAFEVDGKGFAWSYKEKVAGQKGRVERLDVLAVRVASENEKQALLAADPDTFFTDAHYNGYPAILVRLPLIDAEELSELLNEAWRIRAPKKLVREFDAKTH